MTRNACITALDYIRIRACLAQLESDQTPMTHGHLRELTTLLDCASVLMDVSSIPPDIITMRSEFSLVNTGTGKATTYTLVYPEEAVPAENRISITDPLGSSMLGRRTGNIVEVPAGDDTIEYRVDHVSYQPEAAGDCQR